MSSRPGNIGRRGTEPGRTGNRLCRSNSLRFERRASALGENFFADPSPEVHMAEPDTATYARKAAFEAERLRRWLGV